MDDNQVAQGMAAPEAVERTPVAARCTGGFHVDYGYDGGCDGCVENLTDGRAYHERQRPYRVWQ